MGNEATKTHNENSKNYCLTTEEAEKRKKLTDECKVIVVMQNEVSKVCKADVMAAEIEPANKIKDGIRPEEQGDAISPRYAAEFGETLVIVTDESRGKAEAVKAQKENESQKISREKVELERSAQEKYEKNNPESSEEGR